MEAVFFKIPADFRHWLQKHHLSRQELIVGFYKKDTGKPSITWPESVEQALCFGWIDGIRRSRDEESYTVRFTPRKPESTWSAINIAKMEELLAKELVAPAGIAAYEKRKEHNSRIYAYEQDEVLLRDDFLKLFKANKEAWTYFSSRGASYKKRAIHHIMSAKQEKTRQARFEKVLQASLEQKQI